MGIPSTFATTGVSSDNSLSRTGVSVLFSVKLYDFSHSVVCIFYGQLLSSHIHFSATTLAPS